MKRIIFTVTNDLNFDQRMHKISGSLQSAGFDVLLVGREKRLSGPLHQKTFTQKRIKCYFEKGKLFYVEYNIRLLWFLLFKKAEILCAIDLDTIVPVAIAGKFKGSKRVYDAHEYFTEVPEVMHRPAVQKIWGWVEKTFVPQMDACYTVSQSLADIFEKKYHKKFVLIRNVPLLKPDIPLTQDSKFILYQGALNKGRGLEQLIESMQELPINLVLAGEGDLSASLRKMTEDLNLTDRVQFLGWVSPEDLEKLTPRAFLGYNLLENLGKSYYYSLSNKFFDYIHACVPGLSNPFPEYKIINDAYKTGILTNLSTSEIVLVVEKALKDEKYYESLRNNCRAARKDFNWQQEEKKLIEIYNALL
jgi:glycosyltransferase involved in cell wall biosynthesis